MINLILSCLIAGTFGLCGVATSNLKSNTQEVKAEDIPILQEQQFYNLDFTYPINNSFICYDHYDSELHYLYELTGDFNINVDVLYKTDLTDFRIHYNTLNYNLSMRVYELEYDDDRLMFTKSYNGSYDYGYVISGYLDDIMVTNLKSTIVVGYDTYVGYFHLGFIQNADTDLIYDIITLDNNLYSFTSDYFGFNRNFISWYDELTGDDIDLSTHILLSSADIYNNAQNFVKNVVNPQNVSNSYLSGYETGYQFGYNQGSQDSYTIGFNDGYNYGVGTESTVATVFNGIVQVAFVPVNFFLAIFDYDILGVNIKGLVTGILTLMCVVIVVKVISGGGGSKNE